VFILKKRRPDSQLRCYAGEKFREPVATHVTRWASDPFSFGAYSYVPAGGTQVSCHAVFWHACQRHSLCHLSLGATIGA
jgi:Flavin containing amine oxidoreductase